MTQDADCIVTISKMDGVELLGGSKTPSSSLARSGS
jgi:hypothetical protein